MTAIPRLGLFLAYTLLAHYSVLRNSPWLGSLALTTLAASLLYRPLRAAAPAAWFGLAAIAGALGLLAWIGGSRYVLYFPSVALPLAVLAEFGRSLLPGRTPLVSAIAAEVHQPLPPELVGYTRAVTWLWTLVVASICLINLGLIVFAPRRLWSEFANFDVYLILAVVFLGEYGWRRWRFRGLSQPGFGDYLQLVMRRRPGAA